NVGEQGTYPFGESWYSNNSTSQWVFTSYERDRESGNDYALTRSYSGNVGRFMSPDPLDGIVGDPQSWNRYAYVKNDPLNMTDPTGAGFWSDFLNAILQIISLGQASLGGNSFDQIPPWATCKNPDNCIPNVTVTIVFGAGGAACASFCDTSGGPGGTPGGGG